MLDKVRVKNRLESLDAYRMQLKGMLPKTSKEYESLSISNKYAVERLVQLLSDTEMEIVVLLYRNAEPRPAGDVETMLESLNDVFGKDVLQDIKNRRKLRNNLVHSYATSNYDKEVFEIASKTKNIDNFVEKVAKTIN